MPAQLAKFTISGWTLSNFKHPPQMFELGLTVVALTNYTLRLIYNSDHPQQSSSGTTAPITQNARIGTPHILSKEIT
jgi:hypothetical protein